MKKLLALILCVVMSVAGDRRYVSSRHCIDVMLCESDRGAEAAWDQEIEREYPGAVVVFSHGKDNAEGVWCLWPDHIEIGPFGPHLVGDDPIPVVDEIHAMRALYPHRTIVLIACNPSHHVLVGEHNVVYADREVWICPDAYAPPLRLQQDPDEALGEIHEFVRTP